MKSLQESTLGIVGLGLMGGSLALALRAGKVCRRIIGVTRNARTRQAALERGVVDAAGGELGLLAEADVIVLATPVRQIVEQLLDDMEDMDQENKEYIMYSIEFNIMGDEYEKPK